MTDDARDHGAVTESLENPAKPDAARLRLAKWLAYARSRNHVKPAGIVATSPQDQRNGPAHPNGADFPVKGWWKRWTKNLDALEARLSPGAGKQRKAFRKKQSAKAVLERDARRNQKRGEDAPDLD